MDRLAYEHKDAQDALVSKNKREIKTAQEKVRAELRNQIDAVKNDQARAKAEWERDRKKLL